MLQFCPHGIAPYSASPPVPGYLTNEEPNNSCRNKFKFCSGNWILEELERKRVDYHLKTNLGRIKKGIDNGMPATYSHLDGRARLFKNRAISVRARQCAR